MSNKNSTGKIAEVSAANTGFNIEKYQKQLSYIGIGIIVIIGGYFGFKKYIVEPQQEQAIVEMFRAESAFGADSFALALKGNNDFEGFEFIAEEYSMSDAGNLANYYAGICCLHLGNAETDESARTSYFEDATKYLSKFSTSSIMLKPRALGALGDAYSELGEYEKAASNYEKAASASDNEYTCPHYLKKAGLVYEKLEKYQNAVKVYERIDNDFKSSQAAGDIEKYLARAKAAL